MLFCKQGLGILFMYLPSALWRRRLIVQTLTFTPFFFISCWILELVGSFFFSASFTIFLSCLAVVLRHRPDFSLSVRSFDFLHLLTQLVTVFLLHPMYFAIASFPTFGPFGCSERKTISYRLWSGKD